MAKAKLGIKRTCLSCNMRFYDFNRSPIICPGCGAEFDPRKLLRNQKIPRTSKGETKEDESVIGVDVGVDDDDVVVDDMGFVEDDVDDKDEPGVIQDDISDDDELLPNLDKEDD
jgi:uncharacterized protein (TIGR02300 family)